MKDGLQIQMHIQVDLLCPNLKQYKFQTILTAIGRAHAAEVPTALVISIPDIFNKGTL